MACAVISLGAATLGQGESAKAISILEEGIALAKAAGVVEHQAFGLNMLLISLLQIGDFQTAEGVAEEALAIGRQHGLEFLHMMALGSFTPIFSFQGKHERAYVYTEEAIQLARRLRNPSANAMSLQLKGWYERGKQHWAQAEAAFSEAAGLFEAVRDTSFSYISLSEAGHMKRKLGDYVGAEEIYRQTILFFRDGAGQSAVIHQLECFGMVAAFQGQSVRAATLLGAAQALRQSEQSVRLPAEQIEFDQALAHLATEMGESERDAAMAKGAEKSVDETVAFALHVGS